MRGVVSLCISFFAICLAVAPAAAHASPVLAGGTTTNPTGINGISIGGSIYDVTFSETNPSSLPSGPTLQQFASGLTTALNDLGISDSQLVGLSAISNTDIVNGKFQYLLSGSPSNQLASVSIPSCNTSGGASPFCPSSGWSVSSSEYVPFVYGGGVLSASSLVWGLNQTSGQFMSGSPPNLQFVTDTAFVYFVAASFSRARTVPEPPELALMGMGLLALGFSRRKRAS